MKYEIGLVGPDGTASEIQGPFNTASQAASVAEHLNALRHGSSEATWKWAREGEIVINDGKLYFSKGIGRHDYSTQGPYTSSQEASKLLSELADSWKGEVFLVSTL